MTALPIHRCACMKCHSHAPHPDRALHRQINLLASRLDEQQRRWFVALEAMHFGCGGQQLLAQVTGISRHTIERGCRELAAGLKDRPAERIRLPGGGRPAAELRDPALLGALQALVAPETAGDPMARRAAAKRSLLAHLSAMLTTRGHAVSRPTVSRLLRQLGYSPKVNARRCEARSSPAERGAQFDHIAAQRARFAAAGDPIISVDKKKKELIGNYRNGGRAWCKRPEAVLVHDWPQDSIGQAVPYGIYGRLGQPRLCMRGRLL